MPIPCTMPIRGVKICIVDQLRDHCDIQLTSPGAWWPVWPLGTTIKNAYFIHLGMKQASKTMKHKEFRP